MEQDRARGRRRRVPRASVQSEPDHGPAPPEVHPAIAGLRGTHRAAHPDEGTILEASSHLLMAKDWETSCPRFIAAIREAGLGCIMHLHFIKIDHHLITALAERWSYQTNTFHVPVGEITVTLQDVAIILGVCIDGPALIGPNLVGVGRRWESWPDCCDELLGSHPDPNLVYQHPNDPNITTTFRMGQAKSQTCIPLRWLRWTFSRNSYMDLPDHSFIQHVRAYILFILGSFLIPDTSGGEIHLQYLPLMEDLHIFSQYSIGSAVLGHLYRELREATKPRRVNIAGCLHLLQVWSWERLHVGRPTLLVPFPRDIEEKSLGFRWNSRYVHDQPSSHVRVYRDEIDGLQPSQMIWEPYDHDILLRLAHICTAGFHVWQCRVPLISWRRVEWHLPDRVARQFGQVPRVDMEPMEVGFERVDGRGKGGVDWAEYHARYIQIWNDRHAYRVTRDDSGLDRERSIALYIQWYKSWATLYLLKASTDAPITYYPRSPAERAMRDYFLRSEALFQPFFGRDEQTPVQQAINQLEDLSTQLRETLYFADDDNNAIPTEHVSTHVHVDPSPSQWVDSAGEAGASGQTTFPASSFFTSYTPWMTPGAGPSIAPSVPTTTPYDYHYSSHSLHTTAEEEEHSQEAIHEHHHLRDRPRRAPDHYTPGSGAIPPRHRRRRQ